MRKGHFQVGCQKHFELTHPDAYGRGVTTDGVGNHPNAWIAASLEYWDGKAAGVGASAEGGAASAAPLFNAPGSAKAAAVTSVTTSSGAAEMALGE